MTRDRRSREKARKRRVAEVDEDELGLPVTVTDSLDNVSFEFYWYRFRHYGWHRFNFRFQDEVVVSFDMDTGTILLDRAGVGYRNLVQATDRLRNALSRAELDMDAIRPILRLFPNGDYAVRVVDIENSYLIDPQAAAEVLEAKGLLAHAHTEHFDEIRKATTTPSLLIPTRWIDVCDVRLVWDYENAIRNGQRPAILLFKEPHRFDSLQAYRVEPGSDGDEIRFRTPPNFGYRGNHIFFSGRNYYILDGHHRAIAYHNCGVAPRALSIACVRLADGTYPDSNPTAPDRRESLDE